MAKVTKFRPPVGPRAKSRETGEPPKLSNRPTGEAESLAEKHATAMELRKMGHTFRSIAKTMGVNVHTAYDWVQAELIELREKTREDAESVRDLEMERLDDLLEATWSNAMSGDPQAIMSAIRIMERRAKLLGLDAPEKHSFVGALVTPEEAAKMSEDQIRARVVELLSSAGSLPPKPPDEPEGGSSPVAADTKSA